MIRFEAWLVMESCSASLTSRVELAVNFTLTTTGGVLIISLESSIPKGGESNHSLLIVFGSWRAAHLLLANEAGTFACSLSGIVGPRWGFATVSVGFPGSTSSHNTMPFSTLHSENFDLSHASPLTEIVGCVS